MSRSITHKNILVLLLIVCSFCLINSFKITEKKHNLIENEKNKENFSEKTSLRSDESDARETRWSYYYMGRWTWHFPLW